MSICLAAGLWLGVKRWRISATHRCTLSVDVENREYTEPRIYRTENIQIARLSEIGACTFEDMMIGVRMIDRLLLTPVRCRNIC
jgi:hypothetical protein